MKLKHLLYSTVLLSLISTPYLSSICGACRKRAAEKAAQRAAQRGTNAPKKNAATKEKNTKKEGEEIPHSVSGNKDVKHT